ncbi:MAG: DUF6115 domain-containing protein [Thermodesulfobacteriota bacterium]
MEISQLKIWLALQLIIDFVLVAGIFWYLSRVKKELEDKIVNSSSSKIQKKIYPFLSEAEKTSMQFDNLLKEKKKLVKDLNTTLDSRISSLTFLVNRADSIIKSGGDISFNGNEEKNEPENREYKIIELYEQGLKSEDIARKIGISTGEVSMIISLRNKFKSSVH